MKNYIILFAALLALAACDKQNKIELISVADVQSIADMNQAFGWDVFHREVAANPKKNVLISPWSIQTALHMANNGAQAKTLSELLAALHCPGCLVDDINTQQSKLSTLLEEQSGHPKLTTANALFYDVKRLSLYESFKQPLQDNYKASVQTADFGQSDVAIKKINDWVKANTNGKIDKILEEITAEDIAFLINALHFKADWANAFPVESTAERVFTTASGEEVKVPMMYDDRNFTFAEGATLRMVDLPFKDSTYSLTLVQPQVDNTATDWHTKINADALKALYKEARYTRAAVTMPLLKLSYSNDLIETLKQLGVQDAFSKARADFGKIGQAGGRIFINQIKHKAVLEVDEKGAEGAAVTSIGFGVTSLPPTFHFVQPFVIALRHVKTNTLIFTGYVANPLEQ